MTKKEAIAGLLAAAQSTNCQYLTVVREHLILALGGELKETHDDVQGHGKPRVDDPA